jgi:hypothetical protein
MFSQKRRGDIHEKGETIAGPDEPMVDPALAQSVVVAGGHVPLLHGLVVGSFPSK